MDLQLRGKTALVTGSTLGIGYAIATALASEGANVVLNGRNEGRVREAVEKLSKAMGGVAGGAGGSVEGIAADLSDERGIAALVAKLPRVDVLVNNVGIFEPRAFAEIPDADWLRLFQVNVMSGVRASRAYLPGMLKQNWGRVVFISSESGLQIPSEMIHYGMTKSAQIAVARGLAELTAGTGVTVNSVLPGPTRSEGVEEFVAALQGGSGESFEEFQAEFFKSVRPTSLLKRFQTPEEIAAVVALLCSPLGSGVNGSAVRADGGVVRSAF